MLIFKLTPSSYFFNKSLFFLFKNKSVFKQFTKIWTKEWRKIMDLNPPQRNSVARIFNAFISLCKTTSLFFLNISLCPGCIKELSLKTKLFYLASILISSFKISITIFKCSFKIFIQFLLRHVCLKTASYNLGVINCIQFHYCLDVTLCKQVICHRRFDTNLNTHLHEAKYS